jgi:lipopolysaccharide export system permease protein
MTIFARYVLRQSLSALLLILFSLVGVVWIAMALKQLKLVTTKGQDVVTLLMMTTLAVPNLLAIIAPVALLIATIHTLNRLNSDSELIILTASGASIWHVTRPLLALGALVAVGVTLVNHFVMPWSLRTVREKVIELRTDLISQVLLPGRFSSPMSGITLHIRDRSRDGTLHGILITDTRRPEVSLTYLAEYGAIQKTDKTSFLAMKNGHVLRKEIEGRKPNHPPDILAFDTYAVDLEQFESKIGPTNFRPREMYFRELLENAIEPPPPPEDVPSSAERTQASPAEPAPGTKKSGRKRSNKDPRGTYAAELHERLSSPLYPFVFVLFAVAFIGRAQSTRTNQTLAMTFGFVVPALFRLAGMALGNLVTINPIWAPLMYVVPVAGILCALALIASNAHPRRQTRIASLLEDLYVVTQARLSALSARQPKPQPGE